MKEILDEINLFYNDMGIEEKVKAYMGGKQYPKFSKYSLVIP